MRVRALGFGLFAGLTSAAAIAALVACSSSDEASGFATGADASGPPPGIGSDAAAASDAGAGLVSSGVLLVHGTSAPALRVCFTLRPQDPPVPLDALMPESNVVGLDVGAVIRLPNDDAPLGDVVGFPEKALRGQLLPDGGALRSCGELVNSSTYAADAYGFGAVDEDLARGIHVLALVGCPPAARDPLATKERCGPSWTPANGNLANVVTKLSPATRSSDERIPVQLVQLSPSLAARLDGGAIALGLEVPDAGRVAALETPAPLGMPVPSTAAPLALPAEVDYAEAKLVLDVITGADGGARERVLAQSLLDTQRLSRPEALPPSFFATVSSFVVLSVGEIAPAGEAPDAGRDPRARLHLLAVPLAAPTDAGAP